jgi:hypothetical protein
MPPSLSPLSHGPPLSPSLTALTRPSSLTLSHSLTSQVFLSTRPSDGKPMLGLAGLPTGRPLLIIGNHQTFAPDLPMLIQGVLEQRGVLIRGLTHPAAFMQGCEPQKSVAEGPLHAGQ